MLAFKVIALLALTEVIALLAFHSRHIALLVTGSSAAADPPPPAGPLPGPPPPGCMLLHCSIDPGVGRPKIGCFPYVIIAKAC
eukprot:1641255-Amphidinium_carterae.2